jgi:hypothetical protein
VQGITVCSNIWEFHSKKKCAVSTYIYIYICTYMCKELHLALLSEASCNTRKAQCMFGKKVLATGETLGEHSVVLTPISHVEIVRLQVDSGRCRISTHISDPSKPRRRSHTGWELSIRHALPHRNGGGVAMATPRQKWHWPANFLSQLVQSGVRWPAAHFCAASG